jgi:hypothetical protein
MDRTCWFHDTLPYLEAGSLHQEFMKYMNLPPAPNASSALNFPLSGRVVPSLLCPSDANSPKKFTHNSGGDELKGQGFSGNFVGNAGSAYMNRLATTDPDYETYKNQRLVMSAKANGILFAASQVKMSQIEDGSAHTVLLTEIRLVPDEGSNDIRGRYYNPAHGGVFFTTLEPPNSPLQDQFAWCSTTPPPYAPCIYTSENMFITARSYHAGIVNVCRCDGSVSTVSESVDLLVYNALGSRNGGETVGQP